MGNKNNDFITDEDLRKRELMIKLLDVSKQLKARTRKIENIKDEKDIEEYNIKSKKSNPGSSIFIRDPKNHTNLM